MKHIYKNIFVLSILILLISVFNTEIVSAKSTSYSFSSDSSQSRTGSLTIPNLVHVTSTTVRNPQGYYAGNVYHSYSGNTVNLSVSNGDAVSWSTNSGSYVDEKTMTGSQTVSDMINFPSSIYVGTNFFDNLPDWYSYRGYTGTLYPDNSTLQQILLGSKEVTGQLTDSYSDIYGYKTYSRLTKYVYSGSPADSKTVSTSQYVYGLCGMTNSQKMSYLSQSYSSGGYTGTLYAYDVSPPCFDPLPAGSTISYSGTVTKPDTQEYRYRGTVYKYNYKMNYVGKIYKTIYYSYNTNHKYAYDVTVNYLDNLPPEVSLNGVNGIYSEKTGSNVFSVSGSVTDREGSISSIKYKIGSKTGTLASNISSGSSWSGTVTVDGNVPEGNQTLYVWADDGTENGNGSSYIGVGGGSTNNMKTTTVKIDKTAPSLSYTLSPSSWTTGNVDIIPSASDSVAGVREVTDRFTVTSNGTYSYSGTDNVGNTSVANASVTNIDRSPPTITFNKESNNTYSKSQSVTVNITDTRDGTNVGSGVKESYYVWTNSNEFPTSGFTSMSPGQSVSTPSGTTDHYYLHVKSVDNLGQESRKTSSGTFYVDNTVPIKGSVSLDNGSKEGTINAIVSGASDLNVGLTESTAYRFTATDSVGLKVISDWTSSNYKFSGLKGNEDYKVTYEVRDTLGNTVQNNEAKEITTMSYNASSLSNKVVTPSSIAYNINEGNNVGGGTVQGSLYKVYAKDNSGKVVGDISDYSTNLTNRTINSLETNTPYSIWVSVKNKEGIVTEPDMKLINVVYTGAKLPGLNLEDITSNSTKFSIKSNGNTNETQYYIERATNNSFTSGLTVISNWSTSLDVNSTGLSAGTNYYYRIKARNNDKVETSWSETYNFKTVSSKPSTLQVSVGNYNDSSNTASMNISWSTVVGADKYYIYRDNVKIGEVTSDKLSFVDNVSKFNKSYSYEVSVWNDLGDSASKSFRDIKESERSSKVARVSRAKDMTDLKLNQMNSTTAYFDIVTSNLNEVEPQYYMEVRNKGTNTVVKTSSFSNVITNRPIAGLSYGVAYEIWMKSRNSENVENPLVKVVDEFWMNRKPEIDLKLEDVSNGLVDATTNAVYSKVKGYDFIQVRGQVLDRDIIPVGDPLVLRYTVKNSSGTIVNGYNNILVDTITATGSWQDIKTSKGQLINIPLNNNLTEGYYTIEVTATDDQGEVAKGEAKFLVDTSLPKGNLINQSSNKDFGVNLKIEGLDGSIAGLENKAYLLQQKINEGSFNTIEDYSNKTTYDISYDKVSESNTKFSYQALIKDKGGNVLTTNEVEYISAINLVLKDEYFNKEIPSTLEIEWTKALEKTDGLQIEIYRNGNLTAIVDEGSKFEDKELDYERDYTYEFIVVGKDKDGNRLESTKTKVVYRTGHPILIVDAPEKVYKTLFSNTVRTTITAEFKQGGNLIINHDDVRGRVSNNFLLGANIKNKIELELDVKKGMLVPIRFILDKNGLQEIVDKEIIVEEVTPVIKNISPQDYVNKYKN